MSKPKIFLTRTLPDEALQLLHEHCDVHMNTENRVLSKDELLQGLVGMDGLLCMLTDSIDAEVIQSQPNLRVISNYAVGFNNIDIAAATAHRIPVTNTPGVLTETTADFTWALLLAIGRRVVEGDRFTREGCFTQWEPLLLLGSDIYGKTLGIVGAGRIGQAVAKRASGFGMRVLYSNPTPLAVTIEQELHLEQVPLNQLLDQSDFVSLHAPYKPETHHLLGAEQFQRMKRTAFLVNTARGALVDEKALVDALQTRQIAGAGLDVYEHEPKLAEGLAQLDNVVLAPHLGSASFETRTKMGRVASENIVAILNGKRAPYTVNPQVYQ